MLKTLVNSLKYENGDISDLLSELDSLAALPPSMGGMDEIFQSLNTLQKLKEDIKAKKADASNREQIPEKKTFEVLRYSPITCRKIWRP